MPSLDLHAGLRFWNGLYALSDYPVVASVLRRATDDHGATPRRVQTRHAFESVLLGCRREQRPYQSIRRLIRVSHEDTPGGVSLNTLASAVQGA